jgi:ATP-dependent Clp protease ATP-binding subunit ClpC
MPSSKDRQRIEIPIYFYERLAQIAETEDRTITSVLNQLLLQGLSNYQPMWIPAKHLSRLNEPAQHVLTFAREEAQSFNHHYIGTEHVLLGLVREQRGLAAQVLSALGVGLDATRAIIERQIGRGNDVSAEEIDYVPRVRKVLSLAMDEAERQGCVQVRTEHILLGIVREGGGVAANILDHCGVLGKVRQQTFALLGKQSGDASSEKSFL